MKNATKDKGAIATVQGPEVLKNHVIRFTWSTSRGRDTYGYNLLTLWEDGRRVASQCGGGYDMTGAAVADWLESAYPVRLLALARERAGSTITRNEGQSGYTYTSHTSRYNRKPNPNKRKAGNQRFDIYEPDPNYKEEALSGLSFDATKGTAGLDGSCGIQSVEKVISAIGLTFKQDSGNFNKRGGTKNTGVYIVAPSEVRP